MFQPWRSVYSQEDLLDSNLERLPYKRLQAIALAMNVPGKKRRVETIHLIKAVRDGSYNADQDGNVFRSKNSHVPRIVPHFSQAIPHQQEDTEDAKPFGSSVFTKGDKSEITAQEIEDLNVFLINNWTIVDLERIKKSDNSRKLVKKAGGSQNRRKSAKNRSQDALTRREVYPSTSHFSSDQLQQTEKHQGPTNNMHRFVCRKRLHGPTKHVIMIKKHKSNLKTSRKYN